MTVDEFSTRFENLSPGGSLVYHRGDLATDRFSDPTVDEIGKLALQLGTKRTEPIYRSLYNQHYDYQKPKAHDWGLEKGTLIQRRTAPKVFEYIIVKKA